MNHKRVQWILREEEEELQQSHSPGSSGARLADGSVRRHRAEHPHQVWDMDFHFVYGQRLKSLNVINEHSRLPMAIRVGRRWQGTGVLLVSEKDP